MSTPTPNDLGKVIKSSKVRGIIYGTYIIGIVLLGAVQVAYAASVAGQPEWVGIAISVAAYLGAPIGALAAVNTTAGKPGE